MTLALFDLDNTLIAGDSDYAWGQFLVERGLVDGDDYARRNEQFYDDYCRGELDVRAYLRFALGPLTRFDAELRDRLRNEFMAEVIRPMWLPAAVDLLQKHRDAGHRLVLIQSTNRFVTAEALGVTDLIASEPELVDNRYSGEIVGTPCFREGKITCLQEWMARNGEMLTGSWFYSDSHNDLPLLEQVEHPVAVDPDPTLQQIAEQRGWSIVSLR